MTAEIIVDKVPSLKPKALLGIRHVQVALMFTALVFAFGMRVNMSISIVAMTDASNENAFNWSMQTQSIILSSFFWGYILLQIPAGVMAAKFGGSILVTIAIGANAAVSLLIPTAANYGGWQAVCACRVIQGLTQGLLFPSLHSLVAKWVPFEEKSRLAFFVYGGSQIGTVFQLVTSGIVIDYWGWPTVFYVNGTLGAIWTVVYIIFGADSPQKSKMITAEEKFYIQKSLDQIGEEKKLIVPWKSIATSVPFYALIIAQCGHAWGNWTLMTEMPSYMRQILGVDIITTGAMSALPYMSMYLLGFPFSFLSDYILKKKWVSVTVSRKIFQTISEWGAGLALIGLSFVPMGNVTLSVALLTLVVGITAGHYCGYLLVHIDMAPNYAGALMGIASVFSNIIAIIAPLVAGFLLKDQSDPDQWRRVFYVSSSIYLTANLIFLIFGSSQKQPWNEPEETNEESGKKEEKVG